MSSADFLLDASHKLQRYIQSQNYRGYDPYDTLLSPLFKLPILNSRIIRFGAQQVGKRVPFNIRRLIGVKKGLNPVTLGLCIQAYSYLSHILPERRQEYLNEIEKLLDMLVEISSKGYSGICWGYDFDWEARYTKINAYVPTGVATGIITNSLFEAYSIHPNKRIREIILDASKFVVNDLNRSYEDELFCFSYSPVDSQFVLNASLKSARLLAQAYYFNQDPQFAALAKTAVDYVINTQRDDGSWPYAVHDARTWADNYHTGYNLDCLHAYIQITTDHSFEQALDNGLQFYLNNFFGKNTVPKFYNNKTYPIDSTAAAQSLLTLSRFGKLEQAERVASWYIKNMQDPSGGFYFRKFKWYTDRNVFMRWNNAWMFAGLSYLAYQKALVEN